jgi:5-methylcytosine-specific restriction endonuclease McrA
VLREDKKAKFVQGGFWFFKNWRFEAGRIRSTKLLNAKDWGIVYAAQKRHPVRVWDFERRSWWFFHDRFYCEDEGLAAEDVMALLLQRERRKTQQLERARASMRLGEEPVVRRDPIPVEIQRAVWERDRGRCVECGGNFKIQYDHIIPFSMGGASTAENLQILCAECNRQKGASIS